MQESVAGAAGILAAVRTTGVVGGSAVVRCSAATLIGAGSGGAGIGADCSTGVGTGSRSRLSGGGTGGRAGGSSSGAALLLGTGTGQGDDTGNQDNTGYWFYFADIQHVCSSP